jgi:hypothetical protein
MLAERKARFIAARRTGLTRPSCRSRHRITQVLRERLAERIRNDRSASVATHNNAIDMHIHLHRYAPCRRGRIVNGFCNLRDSWRAAAKTANRAASFVSSAAATANAALSAIE